MVRAPCCQRVKGEKKGPWTPEEDLRLIRYIEAHGEGQWTTLPQKAGLDRCGKGCRLRWMNYLRPNVKRGNISKEEEELIIRLHKLLGNRWSLIAGRVPGRTDNEIKNYWNTHLSKRYDSRTKKSNFECSPNPKDPPSTISLQKVKEKTEDKNFQVVGQANGTEPKTWFDPGFEWQNCYYNLINPSLENHGEIWSNLNPTLEPMSGNIDGSWAQLGFLDVSASPCFLELEHSMQPNAFLGFEYNGFGGVGFNFGVQNQPVEIGDDSGVGLSPFPHSCFSSPMGLEHQLSDSIGDFPLIYEHQETMALPIGQMDLGVDLYDGLEMMMGSQYLDGMM